MLGLISSSGGAIQNTWINQSTMQVLNEVSAESARQHLVALQEIADNHNGNRSAGSSGDKASRDYIVQQLHRAGYLVHHQFFQFKKFSKLGKGVLEITAPDHIPLEEEKDFEVMSYSGSGKTEALITAVDVSLGLGNSSSSGCEAEDFANFSPGHIALVQRGTCAFGDKAKNAEKAGASGVIIFNQGDTEDRKGLFAGTLGEDVELNIPVLATTYEKGVELAHPKVKALLSATTEVKTSGTYNILAETLSGDPNNIVMIGAHLDSVEAGPGINDNGSGSAGILEVATKLKDAKLNNKIRFAWWGAEELGLVGSTKYVQYLPEEEKEKIALYLNFDMIASPNYKLGVYDGDGSHFESVGPQGSDSIESLFKMFLSAYGSGSVETPLNGRSDYQAFALAGIPVGGLFTGAEDVKSEQEAKLFGGEAGVAYDACYHKKCDDLSNLNMEAFEINVDAIAFAALTYGHSTASVQRAPSSPFVSLRAASGLSPDAISISCHEEAFIR